MRADGGVGPYSRDQLVHGAYAAFRIVFGALFMIHGIQKIFGFHMPETPPVGSQLWIGGLVELVGGAMIAIGLFTRLAAFICCGQMAVAYFQFHWKLDVADFRWLPTFNDGEVAVLYCFAFLLVAAFGGGAASIDRAVRGKH
jgi:putative oxidoreductase